MEATFSKKEKLKSKKEIKELFSNGKSIAKYPIRLIYNTSATENKEYNNTGVSVSKRNFKRAVDRNHIKRLLRESYRKNKYLVPSGAHVFNFMFLYTDKKIIDHKTIESNIKKILQKLAIQEIKKS